MAYTEIVITRFGDHLVSMLLKDGHPVEFQCVSEKNKVCLLYTSDAADDQ